MRIALWQRTRGAQHTVYRMNQQTSNEIDASHIADCLYYFVPHDNIESKSQDSQLHHRELIPYCIPVDDELATYIPKFTQGRPITFDDLRRKNVTSELLYSWSTSVDLVEDYEIYLKNGTIIKDSSATTFYNCSPSWFGQRCQYTFNEYLSFVQPTFTYVVTQVFDIKLKSYTINTDNTPHKHTIYSCYTHIKCRNNIPSICIDWREICDGKVDCLDDGQDEMFCAELEMNECSEDEYRCHNGAQCIPKEMFNDDRFNPECLDGSDEPKFSLNNRCVGDPSFRCEERSCINSLYFSCGDGECDSTPFLFIREFIDESNSCRNGRHRFVYDIILSQNKNRHVNRDCWKAMFELFSYHGEYVDIHSSHPCSIDQLTEKCLRIIQSSCQSTPQFVFPRSSAAFLREIDLVYDIHLISSDRNSDLRPNYICFANQRCSEYFHQTTQIANKTGCLRLPYSFGTDSDIDLMTDEWYYNLIDLVRMCIPVDKTALNMTHCRADNLIHCQFSQHCISKHRLMDTFNDCYLNADEEELLEQTSCSLNDNYRYKCSIKNYNGVETVCLSSILNEYDREEICLDDKDVSDRIREDSIQTPPFSFLCDGFVDMDKIDNETDETHCEDWSCDNVYTRCDGIWHCLNGLDEANCNDLLCPSYTFPCLLPSNNTLICLPLSRMNDNITDCRGATDERLFCRHHYPNRKTHRYRCWNDSTCVDTNRLCEKDPKFWQYPSEYNDCTVHGDDEIFCPSHYANVGICDPEFNGDLTIKDKILCALAEKYSRGEDRIVRDELHLSLNSADYYPDTLSRKTETVNDTNNNFLLESRSLDISSWSNIDSKTAWYCYRGIYVMVTSRQYLKCLCPPSYYGPRCENQNQRVSMTLIFRKESLSNIWRTIVFNFFIMLIDEEHTIISYEQILYSSTRDCNSKFDINLLYVDQPKSQSKNYSIHIDAFIKNNLTYYASWYLHILFPFLPVNRIASVLTIPIRAQEPQNDCNENICKSHGRCIRYVSSSNFFCQCDLGWKGQFCQIKRHNEDKCHCSPNSLCIESGLCLCPLNQFGNRCYLTRSACNIDTCSNRGLCVPHDERISESNFTCICNDGYWGKQCEYVSTQVDIYFDNIPIPQAMHIHLIKAYKNNEAVHERTTTFTKIPIGQDFSSLKILSLFNILLVEFHKLYYLAILQEALISRKYISTQVNPSRQCLSIYSLLNSTQSALPILHRVKYYHRICRTYRNLACFHDDIYMCLCNYERQANCFLFDHNMTYDCQSATYCKNNAQCYQDHPKCPTKFLCVCSECFYGSRCQFSTEGASFSLDLILTYQIRPNTSLTNQNSIVTVGVFMAIIILSLGFINSLFSTITFRFKQSQQVGCGIYLITASLVSFIPIVMLALKLCFIFLVRTYSTTDPIYFSIGCILIDFILQITLNMENWLTACVAIERAINACKAANFNKMKSRFIAKRLVPFLILITILTELHDPFHRRLIDDEDLFDRRTLCIVIYTS
ncbi:unnamed protein product, partial [Rotaria sp. Silwood2]